MGHEMGKRTPTNYLSRFVPPSLILQSLIRCALTPAPRPVLWTGRTEFTRHASAFYASAVFWRNLWAGCGGQGFTLELGYVEIAAVPLFRFLNSFHASRS